MVSLPHHSCARRAFASPPPSPWALPLFLFVRHTFMRAFTPRAVKQTKELMPLECLCRLVSAGVECRVAVATKAATETTTTTTTSSPPAESRRTTGDSTGSSPAESESAGVPLGSVMESVSTPSILQMAYVELLRTLVSRLEHGRTGVVYAPAAPGGSEDGRVGGVWAGVRALDLEALFR